MTTCWAPWLRWVLSDGHSQQLAVALDATTLGQRFVVLAISVLYRGCAVPVAWKGMPATAQHPWGPEWRALLEHFRSVVSAGHAEHWLVVTDLGPPAADVCWYGPRAWIEPGFQQIKRGGWQWQHTRMTDPARAERLWMAVAVATWWLLSVGGEADAEVAEERLAEVPGTARGRRWRLVAVFHRGLTLIWRHWSITSGSPWIQVTPNRGRTCFRPQKRHQDARKIIHL